MTMTTVVDKLLADAIAHLKLVDDRDRVGDGKPQQFFPAPLSDAMLLAGVLLATRRDLAETRRLVDALAGPMRIEHGRMTFSVNGRTVEATDRGGGIYEIPLEASDTTRGVLNVGPAPKLKHGPGGTGAAGPCDPDCAKCAAEAMPATTAKWIPTCDDCGNTRWIPIGSKRCLKCQERDQLRQALAEACELLDPHARSDVDRARIAELRRLL